MLYINGLLDLPPGLVFAIGLLGGFARVLHQRDGAELEGVFPVVLHGVVVVVGVVRLSKIVGLLLDAQPLVKV